VVEVFLDDEIEEEQPAPAPAKENEMNQSQQTPDQRNLATFNVVGQPLPPEQDMLTINQKPTAEPFFKFWRIKMSGRDFCLFLLIAAMAVTIVYLLAVRTTSSTKLPPAIVLPEPPSRQVIIIDASTKPAADMTVTANDLANNATPAQDDMAAISKPAPRIPAAAQGKPAATAPTPEQVSPQKDVAKAFTYKLKRGEYPLALTRACGMDDEAGTAYLKAHNKGVNFSPKAAYNIKQEFNIPCEPTAANIKVARRTGKAVKQT
jgi:hypothetical protein